MPRLPLLRMFRPPRTAGTAARTGVESAFRLPGGRVVRTGTFHDLNKLPARWQADAALEQVEQGFVAPDGRFFTRAEAEHTLSATGKAAPYGPYSATVAGSRQAPPALGAGHSNLWLRARAEALRRHTDVEPEPGFTLWRPGEGPPPVQPDYSALAARSATPPAPAPEPPLPTPRPGQRAEAAAARKAEAALANPETIFARALRRRADMSIPRNYRALVRQAQEAGGFTYDVATGAQPKRGFAFSVSPENEARLPALTPEAVAEYVRGHEQALLEPDTFLGAWRSPEGEWYLDVSRVLPDREAALTAAREAKQRAVYDLTAGESFEVKP